MSVFFCTEFMAISIGMVTNFSISSADRPGHCVMIVTFVFVTSGKASIGVWRKLTTPMTTTARVTTRMRYLRLSEKAMMKSMNLFIAKSVKN